jgi:glycosyltransferase involved in cell wall biosynthesis
MPISTIAESHARSADDAVPSIDVTVVLPVHNEVGHVREEIQRVRRALEASRYTFELLVIDDGSTDGSKEVLRGIEGIELVDLPHNRGVGFARRLGTRLALGEVVVWTDVDMSYPNDRIPDLVDALEEWCDQVVGARRTEKGSHAWARRPAKWFVRNLACFLVQTHIPDLNSGFRAFRRTVSLPYLHLLPNGFSCVSTLTLCFLSNGHSVRYVPIEYAPRAGNSKFRYFHDTYQYALQVVRMVMTFNPLRVFLPLGGFLLLMAAGKVLYDTFNRDFWITTNAVILTVVAWQVISIGLLADLICRLNDPTRQGRSQRQELEALRYVRRRTSA